MWWLRLPFIKGTFVPHIYHKLNTSPRLQLELGSFSILINKYIKDIWKIFRRITSMLQGSFIISNQWKVQSTQWCAFSNTNCSIASCASQILHYTKQSRNFNALSLRSTNNTLLLPIRNCPAFPKLFNTSCTEDLLMYTTNLRYALVYCDPITQWTTVSQTIQVSTTHLGYPAGESGGALGRGFLRGRRLQDRRGRSRGRRQTGKAVMRRNR